MIYVWYSCRDRSLVAEWAENGMVCRTRVYDHDIYEVLASVCRSVLDQVYGIRPLRGPILSNFQVYYDGDLGKQVVSWNDIVDDKWLECRLVVKTDIYSALAELCNKVLEQVYDVST